MDVSQLVDMAKEKKKYADLKRGATNEEIRTIETSLNIILPKSYKDFLANWGYVRWFGHALFGVADADFFDTLRRTQKARSAILPPDFRPVPTEGNIIESYDGGGFYLLYSDLTTRPGQVGLFLDEAFGREVQYWESFEEFFEYQLTGVENWRSSHLEE